MADYGVNIKVAVQNSQKVKQLGDDLKRTGNLVDSSNRLLAKMAGVTLDAIANVKNLNATLAEAQKNFNKAVLGTKSFITASKDLVATNREVTRSLEQRAAALKRIESGQAVGATPMGSASRERQSQFKKLEQARQNAIRDENRALGTQLSTQNKILATESRRARIQMKALDRQEEISRLMSAGRMRQRQPEIRRQEQLMLGARQYMQPIGPELPRIMQPDRTAQLLTRQSQQRSAILKEMNALSSKSVFNKNLEFALAKQLIGSDKTRNLLAEKIDKKQKDMISNQQALAAQKERALAADKKSLLLQRRQGRQRIGGALSSGLIGGGFPLLFGQGSTAAAGGAIGGLAGGAIGGGFGFALSIVGTALGQAIADAEEFDKSLIALNSGLDGTATSTSITASEINDLADALGRTKDETVEALQGFMGLGANTEQLKNLALIFGKDAQTPAALAAVAKQSDLGKVILANVDKIGKTRARQLLTQLEAGNQLEVELELVKAIAGERERQLIAEKSIVSLGDRFFAGLAQAGAGAEGMAIAPILTPEDLRDERVARFSKKIRKQLGLATADVTDVVQGLRELNELVDEDEGTKADPTINLQKRLNILNKQIASEQKFVGISSEGASIIRRKLALESRIAQIQETGTAERKRLTDQEDIRLSQSIETQAINLENLKFEREATALIERQNKAGEKLLEPLQKKLDAIRDRNAFEKEYGELIMNGSTPAAAKQVIEAQKQKKEIDRLVEKQLESNEILIENLRIKVAETEGTKAHAAAVDALNAALRRRNEIEEKGRIAKGEIKGEKTPAERFNDEIKAIQGIINELNDPVRQAIELSRTLGSAFSESFKGIVSGSMSAQQALANLFQRTADHFLDMAAEMIAAQLRMQAVKLFMSFFPSTRASKELNIDGVQQYVTEPFNAGSFTNAFTEKRALGGAVGAGRPYMVGERGPELFIPGAQGNIVPNGAMGGTSVVVNVDASGTEVQGNQGGAEQLGRLIGQAVQAELIKQKRPGGLLTR